MCLIKFCFQKNYFLVTLASDFENDGSIFLISVFLKNFEIIWSPCGLLIGEREDECCMHHKVAQKMRGRGNQIILKFFRNTEIKKIDPSLSKSEC